MTRPVRLPVLACLFVVTMRTASSQATGDIDVETLHVQGNVYFVATPAGNTTVQLGEDGVLVVDSQPLEMSPRVLSAIRKLSSAPIRYVLNTSAEPNHTAGNAYIASAGDDVIAATLVEAKPIPTGARVVAHENVLLRMAQQGRDPTSWPIETYFTDWHDIYFNGEAVRMFHVPAAHADGDSLVFFRKSDAISVGDIFSTTSYPVIDIERGGDVQGLIEALNRVIDLTVLGRQGEGRRGGGTLVIPGHGRISDQIDVVVYRDMVTIVRDRVRDLIGKGRNLQQVLAARPSLDYDTRFAAEDPAKAARFVEAVYMSLVDAAD